MGKKDPGLEEVKEEVGKLLAKCTLAVMKVAFAIIVFTMYFVILFNVLHEWQSPVPVMPFGTALFFGCSVTALLKAKEK